jgi:hypothetical protein
VSGAATLMVEVSALSAEIAAVAADNAAQELRKVFAKHPHLPHLKTAADAQERAAKELRAAIGKALRS